MTEDAGTVILKTTRARIKELVKAFPPNPFSLHTDKISRVKYCPEIASILDKPNTQHHIRFAFVSLCRPGPDDFAPDTILGTANTNMCGLDMDACDRRMVNCDMRRAGMVRASYEWAINEAVDRLKANIVCVNELGFPSRRGRPYKQVMDFSMRKAEQSKAVIVAGSFHDSRTKYNTGYIFFPKDPELLSGNVPFHKQVSATELRKKDEGTLQKTGEYISIPPDRAAVSFKAYGLNISVMVCLDLMDYSAVANVVQQQDAVDILLIPSCSGNIDAMKKMAQFVSKAMPGGVAIIDHFREKQVTSKLYLFDREDEEPYKRARNIPNGGGKLFTYAIDYTEFKNEKRRKQNRPDYHTLVFGLPVRTS